MSTTDVPLPATTDPGPPMLFPRWGEECERFARLWREAAHDDDRATLVTHILGKPAAHAAALVAEMLVRLDETSRADLVRLLVSRWIVESHEPDRLP